MVALAIVGSPVLAVTATDSTRSAPWGGGTERSQAPSRWILLSERMPADICLDVVER